jgi:hypothetical protein
VARGAWRCGGRIEIESIGEMRYQRQEGVRKELNLKYMAALALEI